MYLKLIKENNKDIFSYYDQPFYVYISLSNMCNANCSFCDVRDNKEKINSIKVDNLIDELSSLGTKYIHFTGGGEPFINDDIFQYLEQCTKKDMNIVLISNGLNLNEEKISKLANYNISSIFFSIDSYNPKIHDTLRGVDGLWNTVTNNINLVKKYMPQVNIVLNHVLNTKNIDDFDKFIKLKENYNFDYINPIVIKDCPSLFPNNAQIKKYQEQIKYYYDLMKSLNIEFLCDDVYFFKSQISEFGDRSYNSDLKCVYPSFCAFVDCPSGLVYPCDCSIHRDRNIYNIGNLNNQTFYEIWDSNKRESLKNMLLNSELNCKTKCDESNCQFNYNYFSKKR